LDLNYIDDFSVLLSLFPTFIFREVNNSESSNQLTSEPASIDISSKEESIEMKEIIIYTNSYEDKERILTENKGKAGIYLWTHKESGKKYVGSAVYLSKRLEYYYKISYISNKNKGNSYIYNAIISLDYSAFSLSIIEYIDISHLSKDEAKTLILEREQYYLDLLEPAYNILKLAGSSLGYKHLEETIAKIQAAKSGKTHSPETIAKIQAANGTTVYVYSKGLGPLAESGAPALDKST